MGAVPGVGAGTAEAGGRLWSFASAEFDERTYELRVDGAVVDIDRKALNVLVQLLENAGEVVSKEEMYAAVWPGRFLSDSVLAGCIRRLRKALGGDPESVIKTAHTHGYRIVASVRVHAARIAPALKRFDFKEGDRPALRPHWTLLRHLGAGGQGEAWLAQNSMTGEQRVFKFALDMSGFAAIKRETALSRFLVETLPARRDFVRVLESNVAEEPYFTELEYAAGGNLEAWTQSRGGLAAIPLAERLEIIARIADALAATHSVGVLHKDLKPSNVLVDPDPDGTIRIKLTDFGSARVLDPERLHALGFTQVESIQASEMAATAMYLAPEVQKGQPATVRGDIYSLGIMLYQSVVADWREPIAEGWEHRVDDPLLRMDIARAVAGDPARRFADAATFASHLRTLEERRRVRAAELAERVQREADQLVAQARAREAELAVERLRARRKWMLTALATLIVGMGLSLSLYLDARRARNEAAAAAANSRAVADFLSQDMFAVVGGHPVQDLTVKELLDAASENLAKRENQMPAAAQEIHLALGNAYWTLNSLQQAEQQLERALETADIDGAALLPAVNAASRLVKIKIALGTTESALPRYEALFDRGRRELGERHGAVLELGSELAFARFALGQWNKAADAYRSVIADGEASGDAGVALVNTAEERLTMSLIRIGDFHGAIEVARAFVARQDARPQPDITTAIAHGVLGRALIELEQFSGADSELDRARRLMRPWVPDETSGYLVSIRAFVAELRLRQHRYDAAVELGEEIAATVRAWPFNTGRRDLAPEALFTLATAYMDSGHPKEAVAIAQRAVVASEQLYGAAHPLTQYARILRANALRLAHDLAGARTSLAGIEPRVLASLGADHPFVAELDRATGLLALARGDATSARKALTEARRIYELRYGPEHAFTRRAATELALAGRNAGRS